ncbi:hybrid sensor histidine kinase/response regulator [Microvirga arabica]|uniref:hybrid sensor histidine kinase/response regulator n=1 Tax=Microvirga arabica TaxID=1128671 RepID=UPI00193AD674|nr:hybrid sensor histidine kinase/response regulator [Microvirga arabica]MBM1172560.1 response regulator [Microvirga arabica]
MISGTIFALISTGIAVHIFLWPQRSKVRRVVAIVSDLATVSCQMRFVGDPSSILFLLYLWITFGNGFRFGIRFLYIAMTVSVICFVAVAYTTPRWHDDMYLSATMLLSLIALPLYTGTLIRKLSNAKAQAEAANRAKTLFLASVSHELRTPLNAIIGLSSLMAKTNLDVEQRGFVATIGAAGDALLRQINSILNLSRVEAGQMPVENVDFDLLEVLSTARAMVLSQAQQKALRLTIHVASWTPLQLRGPKHHLEEILLNLLGNAVKFTESGYITLFAHPVIRDEKLFIHFGVSDTGIGIAAHATDRIFESFTQADDTIINRFGGTGLGLSICRQLITAMGGEIGVNSQEGHGSSFWFTLPFSSLDQKDLSRQLSRLPPPLLVCSNADLVSNLASRLSDKGDTQVVSTLVDVKEHAHVSRTGEQLVFYYSDLPEEVLVAEIASANLSVNPIIIRPESSRIPSNEGVMRWSSSVLPVDFSLEEAQVGTVAAAAQTSLAQQLWHEPNKIELPEASRPLSILVADDNSTNRMVVSKILERGGHSAHCVANGEDALNALETGRFDLVIMDINMPVMTGIEATKLFRFTEPQGTRIPIIALTADATPDVVARTVEAGMDACLTKPVQPVTLLRTVEEKVGFQPKNLTAIDSAKRNIPPVDHTSLIDESLLGELERLGGRDFVSDLVEEFVSDADGLITELRTAAECGDSHRFRLEAHGLQSASANVGAKIVHEICVGWRKITSVELTFNGPEQVEQLAAELERTHHALKRYLATKSLDTSPARRVQEQRNARSSFRDAVP